MSRLFKILLFFFLLIFSAGCGRNNKPIIHSAFSMGSFIEITAYDPDSLKAEKAVAEALDKIQKFSNKLSIFEPGSEISLVNREAAKKPVTVSPEVFEVLKESLRFSRLSDGAFDMTVGPLMELWGFNRQKGRIPEPEEIKIVLKKIGWQNVVLNEKNRTVFFKKEGIKIDLGGIAKGYAADVAVAILRRSGLRNALVNAGGNIYALGVPPGKKYWKIGIRHPRRKTLLGTVNLCDQAVATSGDYENFFEIHGVRYGHIMNPKTGYPVSGTLSVTIVAPRAVDTDGLSTAAFVLGQTGAEILLNSVPGSHGLIISEGEHSPENLNYILTENADKYFILTP